MLERLSQDEARRLEKLAASMAHEIKNPLAGISATVQVLALKLPEEDEKQKYISVILEEIKRLGNILDRFRMLASPMKPVKREIDINEIIEKVVFLEKETFGKWGISLDFTPCRDVGSLSADAEQIKQVILNLFVNARNALESTPAAKFLIRLVPDRDEVKLYFEDNGPGVDVENLETIFEPFFSTMPKGIGLGLAISRQILREHGGNIACFSGAGKGASFVITLPRQ